MKIAMDPTTNQTNPNNSSMGYFREKFMECFSAEFGRPQTPRETIVKFAHTTATNFKLHTFFLPDNLAQTTTDIFTDPQIRSFVCCLRDRYLVELSGSNYSVELLINCIASYGDPGDDLAVDLIPKSIHGIFIEGIKGNREDVQIVLSNNTFLLIPILIYFCFENIHVRVD